MIIPARSLHVDQMLTEGLRSADLAEIAAASGLPPDVVLRHSYNVSERCWAMTDGQCAYALLGVATWPGVPKLGIPWLLATDEFKNHRREIVANTRRYVREMGEGYHYLINYTDLRHTESHRWLRWAGFQFDSFEPEYGAQRRPFLRFSKEA